MNLDILIQAVQSGHYLLAVFMMLSLVNVLLSNRSAFPLSLPAWANALATIVLGQALTLMAMKLAGQAWWPQPAIHSLLVAVVAIGASHSIFGVDPPKWMQSISGTAQTILNGGTLPAPPPDPAAAAKTLPPGIGGMLAMIALLGALLFGCAQVKAATP